MKKTILTLSALFLFSLAFSQSNRTTGPAAKNAKPWLDAKLAPAYSLEQRVDAKGPEAKNAKAWKTEKSELLIISTRPMELKGPKAKNAKPWDK